MSSPTPPPAETHPVLHQLQCLLAGTPLPAPACRFQYPPPIARTLGFRLIAVELAGATLEMVMDLERHANQQGTVHGGLIAELADSAMGHAHSTLLQDGESLTSLDLRVDFLRPAFAGRLRAVARCVHRGRRIARYECELRRDDDSLVARAHGTMMTLRGAEAEGR